MREVGGQEVDMNSLSADSDGIEETDSGDSESDSEVEKEMETDLDSSRLTPQQLQLLIKTMSPSLSPASAAQLDERVHSPIAALPRAKRALLGPGGRIVPGSPLRNVVGPVETTQERTLVVGGTLA